ncbi:hypothetical protein SPRG_18468, partial [Saprolegnia parasitica CBS 223.65]
MMVIRVNYVYLSVRRTAARWLERALPVLEATLGPDPSTTTRAASCLGNIYLFTGQLYKSLTERLAATAEQTLGPDNSDTNVHKMSVAALELMTESVPEATSLLLRLEASLVKCPKLTHQLRD